MPNLNLRGFSKIILLYAGIILCFKPVPLFSGTIDNKDSIKIENLILSSDTLLRAGEYKTALTISGKAYSLAISAKNQRCAADALHAIGNAYYYLADYPNAISFFQQSISLGKSLKYLRGLVFAYTDMGLVYFDLGDYATALDYALMGDKHAKELGNQALIGMTLNTIGIIYEYQSNLEAALQHYEKSLLIRLKLNDLQGLGYCYHNLGSISFKRSNFSQALQYYQKSLELRRKVGDKYVISSSLNNLGVLYDKLQKPKEAEKSFAESLGISATSGDKYMLAETQRLYAEYFFRHANLKSAEYWVKLSLQLAESINALDLQKEAQQLLYRLAEKQGHIAEAFLHLKSFDLLKDSIYSAKKFARIHQLQSQLQFAGSRDSLRSAEVSKEAAISKKSRQTRLTGIAFAAILFLLLLVLFTTGRINLNVNRQKKKMKAIISSLISNRQNSDLPKPFQHVFFYTNINLSSLTADNPEKDEEFIEFFTQTLDSLAESAGMIKVYTVSEEFVFYSPNQLPVEKAMLTTLNFAFDAIYKFKQNNALKDYIHLFPKIGIHAGVIYNNIVGTRYAENEQWCEPIEIAATITMHISNATIAVSDEVYKHLKGLFNTTSKGNYSISDDNFSQYFVINKNEN